MPEPAAPAAYGADPEAEVTGDVTLCPDGVYRWIYEFEMMKNPVILFTVWKVLGLALGIVALFMVLLALFEDGIAGAGAALAGFLPVFVLLYLFLAVVVGGIAYFVVAASYGWKYMVLFEMDDHEVRHIQMEKQFGKAQGLAWLAVFAGAVAGSLPAMGAGLLSMARDRSVSEFADVKNVIAKRRWNTIHVNKTLYRNQVYASDRDFDFVLRYIADHCVNAKIKGL